MSSFRFKKFLVEQNNSAMRVNTDGVLLGAWLSLPKEIEDAHNKRDKSDREGKIHSYKFLDIGTGTGVIALMAAQRATEAISPNIEIKIDALEIEQGAFVDAKDNFNNSPWGANKGCNNISLSAYNTSLQEFSISDELSNSINCSSNGKYDLIFSNPPYFVDSLKSNDSAKNSARHTDSLSQADLIKHTLRLIKPKGTFAVVLPITEGEAFISKIDFIRENLQQSGREAITLFLSRLSYIKTTEKKAPKRVLIEFVAGIATSCNNLANKDKYIKDEIIISSNGEYSKQYINLTKEFYLNF